MVTLAGRREDERATQASSRSPTTPWLWLCVAVGAVLRIWGFGARPANLDESFEALTGRRAISSLPGYAAHHDTAPPLTYLLREPFLAIHATTTSARVPSVLAAVAALVLFAVWMRRYGILGVSATALFAVNGFLVHYGREARMYAFLELVGVAAAMMAASWLHRPRRVHLVGILLITLAAMFLHVEGVFLAAGLLMLPGFRRDRAAWQWRAVLMAAVALYALTWGWALLLQRTQDHQPGAHASPAALVDVVGALFTTSGAIRLFVVLAVVCGAVVLARRHPLLSRTFLACFAVPVGLAFVAAVPLEILMPRFFAFAAWAPLVAVGALVDAAARRQTVLGIAALAVAIVCTLPTGVDAPGYTGPAAHAVDHLARVTRPGDAVMVRPYWLAYLIEWNLGSRRPVAAGPTSVLGVDNAHVTIVPGGRRTTRVWLLEPADVASPVERPTCAPPWTDGVSVIRCIRR